MNIHRQFIEIDTNHLRSLLSLSVKGKPSCPEHITHLQMVERGETFQHDPSKPCDYTPWKIKVAQTHRAYPKQKETRVQFSGGAVWYF